MNEFNIELYEKCIKDLGNNRYRKSLNCLNISTVNNSRFSRYITVFFSNIDDDSTIRFCIYLINNQIDITLYKNGEELGSKDYEFTIDNKENYTSYFPKLRTALYNFMARNEDIMKEIKKDLQGQLDSVYNLFSNSITNLFLGGDNE